MAFRIFVDSNSGVTIEPEYDFAHTPKKIENRYRARDGSEYVYKWSDYDGWKMSVSYVDSLTRYHLNNWWRDNTDLLFKSESESAVYSVHLVGRDQPIQQMIKPYTYLFKGFIDLETY